MAVIGAFGWGRGRPVTIVTAVATDRPGRFGRYVRVDVVKTFDGLSRLILTKQILAPSPGAQFGTSTKIDFGVVRIDTEECP